MKKNILKPLGVQCTLKRLINFLTNKKKSIKKRRAEMSNFQNKSKPPYVGCKSNRIYPTGQKPPIAQYRRKIT